MDRILTFFKSFFIAQITLFILIAPLFSAGKDPAVDAVSSATSLSVKISFPENITLTVFGKVKNIYHLNSKYLSTLSTVRIRTKEADRDGRVTGAYSYIAIPVNFLFEGIKPLKTSTDLFDRPLDLIITFISKTGQKSHFSYGELTMCNDSNPVSLAYYKDPVLPSKEPEKYTKNRDTKPLSGLKLICPRDKYTNRYLDNVISIKFSLPKSSDTILPKLAKGKKCNSNKLFYIKGGKKFESSYSGVKIEKYTNWIRIGHGRGIKSKSPESVTGYSLRDFLFKNFGENGPDDFYLFVGCDGYRSIFSWSEIFRTYEGGKMILITKRNGLPTDKDITLGIIGDFFVDRDIHGLSFVEKITISKK